MPQQGDTPHLASTGSPKAVAPPPVRGMVLSVWLRDLATVPGYRAAVAGLGPAPEEVREHDGRALLEPVR